MKIVYQEEKENREPEESVLNPEKQHLSDLSKKERRRIEKEKLSRMGLRGKLEYIWMYYKAPIFGGILFIAACLIGWDIYKNAQIKNVLNVFVVNGFGVDGAALEEQAAKILGTDSKKENVICNVSLNTNEDGESLNYMSQTLFVTQFQSGTLDVMVMPETLFQSLSKQDMFQDMETLLGEEAAQFGEHMQEECLVFDNAKLPENLQLAYETVCMAVPENSRNKENAVKWMKSFI